MFQQVSRKKITGLPGGRIFHRVVHHVEQGLPRPFLVKEGLTRKGDHFQANPLFLRGRGRLPHRVLQQCADWSCLRRGGQDSCLQPGGLDQSLNEESQLLRLLAQGGGLRGLLRRQVPFRQEGGVQQNVCHRRLGLVGDVGDQRLNRRPLFLHALGRGGASVEEAGQPALQGGGRRLVKPALPKAPVQGGGEHPLQAAQQNPSANPLIQAESQAQYARRQAQPAPPGHFAPSQV